MLDLNFIRENPDTVQKAAKQKGISLDVYHLLAADRHLAQLKRDAQALEARRNLTAKAVADAGADQRGALIAEGKTIAGQLADLQPELRQAEHALQDILWLVPNIPAPDAPIGTSDADNVEVRRHGTPPQFDFIARDHVELLTMNDWADLERVAQVSGTRSYALKNELVLLEMALHRLAMDVMREQDFTLISVPSLARETAFYGTGHFPGDREQAYHLTEDDLYLAGTGEVVINSLHSNEILNATDLPLKYAAFSPCFRREAGSSGKDTRGLVRVHQFLKTEQYVVCRADAAESQDWHMRLLGIAETILQKLELPYRVLDACTGDMGLGKVRMYDLEAWVPSQDRYRETHSCSMLDDWQARRANLRYRDTDGVVRHCHTLNNTAIATPRILAPILENHQQADGSVKLPAAIVPYMGMARIGKAG